MPTLQFKGKNIIWNHHLSVPYHSLEEIEDLNFQPQKEEGNLIVEGDNLVALKALLPKYAGKVTCIYIDPPYNTGNEGWAYNDKVNSPLIRDWIGNVVGRDDLTKHDKWLCMMAPRLKLLKELMSDIGLIFISIDDHEIDNLRIMMNELFGEQNFIAQFIWEKIHSTKNDARYVSDNHEYILCYAQEKEKAVINLLPRTEKMNKNYKNPDNDPRGDWASGDLVANEERKEGYFEVVSPRTGKKFNVPKGKHWVYSKENLFGLIEENRIYFGKDGNAFPRLKRFFSDVQKGRKPDTLWLSKEVGHNQEAKRELKALFGNIEYVDKQTPKPVRLIDRVLKLSSGKNSIVLDSFAGSGTTMHAVMQLNSEDGGNRKCIMVQMPENSEAEPGKNVCRDITRERVKLAVEKYGFNSGFKYLRLGPPIDPETMLDGDLPTYQQFAEYVYYLATGGHLADKSKVDASKHLVGMEGGQAVYLIYEQDIDKLTRLALTLQIAELIVKQSPGKRRVVFAPSCFLDEEYMTAMQIEFVSVPYNLFERKNNG